MLEETPAFYHFENSAQTTDIPMSGSGSKATVDQRGDCEQHTENFVPLDCRQILVPARLLHRYRRTQQVHLQVQQQSEVTIGHQETDAIHQNPK